MTLIEAVARSNSALAPMDRHRCVPLPSRRRRRPVEFREEKTQEPHRRSLEWPPAMINDSQVAGRSLTPDSP